MTTQPPAPDDSARRVPPRDLPPGAPGSGQHDIPPEPGAGVVVDPVSAAAVPVNPPPVAPSSEPARDAVEKAGQTVRCRRCERELQAGSRFCNHCGAPLDNTCPSCSRVNAPDSRFCAHCGKPLAIENPSAETQATPAAAPGARMCPRCRKANEVAARFCYSCGLPLDDARLVATPSPGGIPPATPLSGAAQGEFPALLRGRPAGFWIRLLALLIDSIILGVAQAALWPPIFDRQYLQFGTTPGAMFDGSEFFYDVLIRGAYFVLLTSLWGTTLGKRILGMWVVDNEGRRISILRSLGRYLATILSAVILLIGYIMVAFRRDKRALHDLMADTWVVIK